MLAHEPVYVRSVQPRRLGGRRDVPSVDRQQLSHVLALEVIEPPHANFAKGLAGVHGWKGLARARCRPRRGRVERLAGTEHAGTRDEVTQLPYVSKPRAPRELVQQLGV